MEEGRRVIEGALSFEARDTKDFHYYLRMDSFFYEERRHWKIAILLKTTCKQ